ncbi:hypothetical protein [Enterobacter hormaechei]|uniref:hypothetical protein n=1 Tax=Enterobacter hormaechei TaxID=158836 RepID=UPI0032DAD466
MRLGQLHRYLGDLLASGMDEHLLVCVPDGDSRLPSEVDRLLLAAGTYSEDASPGYTGFLLREGNVLVLTSGPGQLEQLTGSHSLTVPSPAAPVKSWPEGCWRTMSVKKK